MKIATERVVMAVTAVGFLAFAGWQTAGPREAGVQNVKGVRRDGDASVMQVSLKDMALDRSEMKQEARAEEEEAQQEEEEEEEVGDLDWVTTQTTTDGSHPMRMLRELTNMIGNENEIPDDFQILELFRQTIDDLVAQKGGGHDQVTYNEVLEIVTMAVYDMVGHDGANETEKQEIILDMLPLLVSLPLVKEVPIGPVHEV